MALISINACKRGYLVQRVSMDEMSLEQWVFALDEVSDMMALLNTEIMSLHVKQDVKREPGSDVGGWLKSVLSAKEDDGDGEVEQ